MTLRLHDLDPNQQAVLSQLLQGQAAPPPDENDDDDGKLTVKEEVAALKEKLDHYMASNKFSCVQVDLQDGTKFLRYNSQRSPRKLTLEAVQQALLAITEDDLQAAATANKKKKDTSLAALLTELVFRHIRDHHYGEYFTLSLDDTCQRNVVPHHASSKTAAVVQLWLDKKAELAQLNAAQKRSKPVVEKQPLLEYFQKTPDLGNERSVRVGGKEVTLRRKTRVRTVRTPVTQIKSRFQWQLQRYHSLPEVKKHSSQLAESLLAWIEEQQTLNKVVTEDVDVKTK